MRRELIALIAPLVSLLSNFNPSRLLLGASVASLESMEKRRTNRLDHRDDILVAGGMHPDGEIRHAVARLVVHVSNTVMSGLSLVSNRVRRGGDRRFDLALARLDHKAASEVLESTLNAAREPSSGLRARVAEIEVERERAEEEFACECDSD
jgi:hypothetical protein